MFLTTFLTAIPEESRMADDVKVKLLTLIVYIGGLGMPWAILKYVRFLKLNTYDDDMWHTRCK